MFLNRKYSKQEVNIYIGVWLFFYNFQLYIFNISIEAKKA